MYNCPGMMKITKEDAVKVLNEGTTDVYLLYEDGTEAQESDIDTVLNYEGEVGIEMENASFAFELSKAEIRAIQEALGWDMNSKIIPSVKWLNTKQLVDMSIEDDVWNNGLDVAAMEKRLAGAITRTDERYERYLDANDTPCINSRFYNRRPGARYFMGAAKSKNKEV